MRYREVESAGEYLARLEMGSDWRGEIEALARAAGVEAGWFGAVGAVRDAELWFYDQDGAQYRSVTFDEPLTVAACAGSVARLDGDLYAQPRAVLARESGQAVAGHLERGTVFDGEVHLRAFAEPLVREPDDVTGLDTWL